MRVKVPDVIAVFPNLKRGYWDPKVCMVVKPVNVAVRVPETKALLIPT